MRTIVEGRKTKVISSTHSSQGIVFIGIEGLPSGNFRITVRPLGGETELFILRLTHFEQHPLKINQWR